MIIDLFLAYVCWAGIAVCAVAVLLLVGAFMFGEELG